MAGDHIESRSAEPARTGSLLVVGVGITGIGQVTLEAEAAIKAADQVFYLVLERTTELWLRLANPRASTLSDLYAEGKERRQTYAEMTARIVDAVRQGQRVCAVFYGHPAVFVESSHAAVRELVADGYQARILPGISADACLYAELGFNPGAHGVQSFEATDFLRARRIFDPSSNLLLWQVGVLGEIDARVGGRCLPERLHTLVEYLRPHYPPRHEIVLYYAPTFAAHKAIVERVALDDLPRTAVSPLALAYVPPAAQRPADPAIEQWARELRVV